MIASEGAIKFSLQHHLGRLPAWADTGDLKHWFLRCRKLDLIGQDPHRYAGAAYGNISQRGPEGFLITGTRTGGKPSLDDSDFSWVRSIDLDNNSLLAAGPARPSSESMTHDQVYRQVKTANFVIHVHSPSMWQNAGQLGLSVTAPSAEYGTPAMAREVDRLLRDPEVRTTGAFSMGGHEDGIVVFGDNATQAGKRLEQLCERLN